MNTQSRKVDTVESPGSVRRTQEDRRRITKERLLRSAIAHIIDAGFENFSMSAIAKDAGYTRGAINHHFPSREVLVTEVVNEVAFAMLPQVLLPELVDLGLEDRVSRVVDLHWKTFGSKTYYTIIEIIVYSRHESSLYKEVSKALVAAGKRSDIEWVELFRDSNASTETLHDLRTLMLATMRGLALRSMVEFSKEDCEHTISILKQTLLKAVAE